MIAASLRTTAALLFPLCAWAAPPANDAGQLERGRYLVQIAGCNDCHTDNYLQAPDQVRKVPGYRERAWAGTAPGEPPMPATCAWCCRS